MPAMYMFFIRTYLNCCSQNELEPCVSMRLKVWNECLKWHAGACV